MDAIKFIKEMGRMCDSNRRDNCDECPFTVNKDTCFMGSMWHNPEEAVEIVEQWDKEHPIKTYRDDFLEKFPNAQVDKGNIEIPWCDIFNEGVCKYETHDVYTCYKCWDEPIEE